MDGSWRRTCRMKTYRVRVEGKNFWFETDGKVAKHGFFQTHWIDADDERDAVERARHRTLTDRELLDAALNDEADPPVIAIDEVVEADPNEDIQANPTGKAFYPMRKWWQFWLR